MLVLEKILKKMINGNSQGAVIDKIWVSCARWNQGKPVRPAGLISRSGFSNNMLSVTTIHVFYGKVLTSDERNLRSLGRKISVYIFVKLNFQPL